MTPGRPRITVRRVEVAVAALLVACMATQASAATRYFKAKPKQAQYAVTTNHVAAPTFAVTGAVPGEDVVQCYIGAPGVVVDRPVKQLQGFARIALAPGEQGEVSFVIPLDRLRWRDPSAHVWRMEPGTYTVFVGNSSADCRTTQVTL